MDEATEKRMLTVPETARVLRISRNLAYTLIARGEIPAIRFGRVIRVPRAALERRLEVWEHEDVPPSTAEWVPYAIPRGGSRP